MKKRKHDPGQVPLIVFSWRGGCYGAVNAVPGMGIGVPALVAVAWGNNTSSVCLTPWAVASNTQPVIGDGAGITFGVSVVESGAVKPPLGNSVGLDTR